MKKSVNQDDVSAYHLFYADKVGTPGTDITFFDWPQIGPDQRGTDSIVGTAFRVSSREGLDFWADRFEDLGIRRAEMTEFAGRQLLPFEDPEGQRLYLVNDQGAEFDGQIWPRSDIPEQHCLRGLYSTILSVPAAGQLASTLTEILTFEEVHGGRWIDGESAATIFSTNRDGGPGAEAWLLDQPQKPAARLGAGGTHHAAFRVPDAETQATWRSRLSEAGLRVTPQIDRYWFHSIYFRVSNGILFEIATDGPGFAIDEDPNELGEKLVLPPFLEPRREEIEAELTPIGD